MQSCGEADNRILHVHALCLQRLPRILCLNPARGPCVQPASLAPFHREQKEVLRLVP